eukprot:scaffold1159_cov215-Pinguiococcus_pyrenoidosus.AAC.5
MQNRPTAPDDFMAKPTSWRDFRPPDRGCQQYEAWDVLHAAFNDETTYTGAGGWRHPSQKEAQHGWVWSPAGNGVARWPPDTKHL